MLEGGMLIKVKTLTGKETEVEIEPTDTVRMIKQQIQEILGIRPEEQRDLEIREIHLDYRNSWIKGVNLLLYCGGKVMNDDKTITEHDIENGSLLQLVKASRGGGK